MTMQDILTGFIGHKAEIAIVGVEDACILRVEAVSAEVVTGSVKEGDDARPVYFRLSAINAVTVPDCVIEDARRKAEFAKSQAEWEAKQKGVTRLSSSAKGYATGEGT